MPTKRSVKRNGIKVEGVHGPFDALGIRGDRLGRHSEFGLYTREGLPIPACDTAGNLFTSAPRAQYLSDAPVGEFVKPVLFAGLAPQQFGHVILNSLGRLWALQYLPPDTALLYLPRNQANFAHYPFLKPILELLSIKSRVLLHNEAMRYRSLYTSEDFFGERHTGAMKAQMRDWLWQRLPPTGPITKGRRVYLTRSQLGPKVGRYCNEELIEHLLRADGYEVVAPERMSLPKQVALMQDAETLVFAESSALHLYGLVQRAGQRVGLIQRRNPLPQLMVGQLRDGPADHYSIDAISKIYWPPQRQDNASIATLDFDILRDRLVAGRFLSPQARWRGPYAPEVSASLHAGLAPGTRLIPDQQRSDWLRARRRKSNA